MQQQSFDSTDDVFADAEKDDHYGLVRDFNFHDFDFSNRRRRCRFMETCNGNNDGDCSSLLDDPQTAVICLRPILPSPSRELSYTPRTGWRYQPRQTPFLDRLGTGVAESNLSVRQRQKQSGNGIGNSFPMPSTKMIIPASFGIRDAEKRKLTGEIIGDTNESNSTSKRLKLSNDNDSATVVTNSTAGDSVQNSAFPTLFPATAATAAVATTTTTTSIHTAGKPQQTAANDLITSAKAQGSPKEILYKWYGKKPRKIQIKAEQYLTWDDGKVTEKRFCAIFVCPLTKEAFLAGPRSETDVPDDSNGLYWFSRKVMAEHAAAARAWDCLSMRESGGMDSSRGRLCALEPYWPSQKPRLPIEHIPAKILERLPPEQGKPGHASIQNDEVRTSPKTTPSKTNLKTVPRIDENAKMEKNDGSVVGQDNEQSNKNFNQRDSTSRNFGRGYHHKQSSQQQSNHHNEYGNRVRDVQQYRAQRMPYGQNNHYGSHQGMHYQPNQEPQQISESNSSYPNYNQSATPHQQIGHYGPGVPQQQQIPGQNHFGFQQQQQQNQYFPQQPPAANNHLQYGGVIHDQHLNIQQHNHQQQIPPPPPPPPNGPSQNYPTGSWGGQNQYQTNRFQQF